MNRPPIDRLATKPRMMRLMQGGIASAISAYELTYVGQRIESDSFKSFEVYGTITLLYLGISSLMLVAFGWIRQRLFRYPVK